MAGDTHIPDRAERIHPSIKKQLEYKSPFDYLLFTGDLTSREVIDWLNKLSGRVLIVRGNMDYLPLPRNRIVDIDTWKTGLIHGDEVHPRGDTMGLTRISIELGVDILVSGHTHSPFIKTGVKRNILLLNPGSLTGVWGGGGGSFKPSYIILEAEGLNLYIELHILEGGSLVIEKYMAKWSDMGWNITRVEEQ
ncbi:MAG: YfcE family phosphodiesterase [Desulfurococcus sp.]|uniref:YfcE family phosphodiesterase n=2 Tax=Desulfurococcus sp. TaxID=51678 RepID=UPI00315F4FFE